MPAAQGSRSGGGGGRSIARVTSASLRAADRHAESGSATVVDVNLTATDGDPVGDLVVGLASARDAAAGLVGREPLGVRAVEPAIGRRRYLVAFDGPAFLCLTGDLVAETDLRPAREAASASLLWETVEAVVDSGTMRALAQAVARLLAMDGETAAVSETLEVVAARALELAAWRDDPLRALASLPALDEAVALHERFVGAYARFVRASEPLVAVQDGLSPDLVAALREVEECAGRARATVRLADLLAGAMPECEEGAEQMVAAHLTRLRPERPA